MAAPESRAFERRLGQVVRKRLEAGQDPAAVLAELKTRLDPPRAEAVLADAIRRAGPRRALSGPERALLGAALVWAGVLALQNLGIVAAASQGLAMSPEDPGGELGVRMAIALAKIGLLVASGGVAVVARWPPRFLFLAGVILYAFPFGVGIEGALLGRPPISGAALFLQVSALLSYASAGALAALWIGARRASPAAAETRF